MKSVRLMLAAAAAAALLMLPLPGGAWAAPTPALPATGPALPSRGLPVILTGTVEYVTDLETPHYEIAGVAITAPIPAVLAKVAGQTVTVTGVPDGSVSILMRPELVIRDLKLTLNGVLQPVTDQGDTHYELDGFILKGADGLVTAQGGAGEVAVTGTVIWQLAPDGKFILAVSDLQPFGDQMPDMVVVGNKAPAFPTAPALKESHLMLPLRAVIETAGGEVAWDPELRAVRVTVGAQSTSIRIDSRTYGGGELSVAPYLQNGCTLAPLDLFIHLGMNPQWDGHILYLARPGDLTKSM